MVKEKRILSYFIGWLLLGFVVCFIGINKIFAANYYLNYEYIQQYYDNNGSNVSAVTTTWNESLQSYISGNITTSAGSYGAGLAISSPIPLIQNHTYTLSLYFEETNNIAKSSKWGIGIGTSLTNATSNYTSNSYGAQTIQNNINNNSIIQYVFKANINANYIFIPWTTTTTTTQDYVVTQINIDDLGSEGISQEAINNSLTNQTNELNNSIQNSTNTITGAIGETENNINSNIDDMESAIIDSNKETQEVIKDQFNNCRDSVNIFDENKYFSMLTNDDGVYTGYSSLPYSLYGKNKGGLGLTFKPNTSYTISFNAKNTSSGKNTFSVVVLYDDESLQELMLIGSSWKTYKIVTDDTKSISMIYLTYYNNEEFSIKNFIISPTSDYTSYEPYGEEICTNKLDDTNDKLNDIQGALTDDSPTDMSILGDTAGWLPPGPVDSIINLPLTFFLNLSQSLSSECRPVSLPLPYVNKNIELPCINSVYEKIGITGIGGFYTWVGLICSAVILFNYLLDLYHWVDKTLTMRENTMPGYYEDKWGGGA